MARTVLTIIGMSDRNAGTSSKTGKSYDFVEAAFEFVNPRNKKSVAVATIDGQIYDKLGLHVGDQYDAIVNQFNGKTYVDLIDPVY